ncbi:MAG: hypothetical protein Q4G70_07775 [Pseudomonadota bacterium]|nr:hypothetical protein [Pseudomonadota bacterium]
MKPNAHQPASQWKSAVLAHAAHLNDYILRGDACDWQDMDAHDPAPDLSALLPQMLAELRAANAEGSEAAINAFREHWPPMHEATLELLEESSQGFGALAWLPDGDLLVRTGCWYEPGRVLCIQGLRIVDMPHVEMFGLSPNQRVLALAANGSVRLVPSTDCTNQAELATFSLPDGSEGLPAGHPVNDQREHPGTDIQLLLPFDDASGVVVVQSAGVFLLTASGTTRLLPTDTELAEAMKDKTRYPVYLDMCHAAISPDGRWIVCGAQDGPHRVFNARGELVDSIGPHGEYPHHAAFFADGRHAAMNACHFYNGATIAVDASAFGGIQTDYYEEHPAVTVIDPSARVYASAPAGHALVLGDAQGYLWARDHTGQLQWKQYVGGTICAMAASADGARLAVGTYSGTVHIIDLADTRPAPEQVGVRARKELRRWVFWKKENQPLAW